MIVTMHLKDKHVTKRIDFKGDVSGLVEVLKKRYGIKDNILSDDYSILVDGKLAEPDTKIGETVAIIHTISGG